MISNHKTSSPDKVLILPIDLHSEEVQQALELLKISIAQMTIEEQQARDLYALQLQFMGSIVAS